MTVFQYFKKNVKKWSWFTFNFFFILCYFCTLLLFLDLSIEGDSSGKDHTSEELSSIPQNLSGTYSADGGQGNYEITGSLLFGVWHKNSTLHVELVQARHLAQDPEKDLPDPFVQVLLLPDGKKWKTNVKKKTTEPGYYEKFEVGLPNYGKFSHCWLVLNILCYKMFRDSKLE